MTPAEEIEQRLMASGVHAEIAQWCAQRHVEGDSTELLQLMLLRALWSGVLEQDGDKPLAVKRWPELAASGAPFVDGEAAKRLLDAGASATDLDALIVSAQVLALYKACQTLDEGGAKLLSATLGPELAKGLGWAVVVENPLKTPPKSLGGLHSTFEQLDPRAASD